MKLKFINEDKFYAISSYSWKPHIVTIKGLEISEPNLCGFYIYLDDEQTIIGNYDNYTYLYSIKTPLEYCVSYTDIEGNEEMESQEISFDNTEFIEVISPLSNQELTECMADLMYEISLIQLGIEV